MAARVLKPIPNIPDGLDEPRVARVPLDLAAQGGDAAVHAAVGHDHLVAPDGGQDAVPSQRPPGALHEELQQPELLGGELDLGPSLEQLVGGQIEAEVAELVAAASGPWRRRKAFTRASSSRMPKGLVT